MTKLGDVHVSTSFLEPSAFVSVRLATTNRRRPEGVPGGRPGGGRAVPPGSRRSRPWQVLFREQVVAGYRGPHPLVVRRAVDVDHQAARRVVEVHGEERHVEPVGEREHVARRRHLDPSMGPLEPREATGNPAAVGVSTRIAW